MSFTVSPVFLTEIHIIIIITKLFSCFNEINYFYYYALYTKDLHVSDSGLIYHAFYGNKEFRFCLATF